MQVFIFSEFYEDILSIICTCTCFQISQSMWTVYYMLYEAFQRDAFDYFAGTGGFFYNATYFRIIIDKIVPESYSNA